MSQWTPQQEAAITAKGASLVVSAAAGSGKTSVLVERLIRLLADEAHPTPAERLVVVTFTNDAAAEVRSRLSLALAKQMECDPTNDWLRRQQTMLQSAHISTIHSFCFDLLRDQFAAAGLSAGFRIADAHEETILRAEAMAEVMEDFSKRAAQEEHAAQAQHRLLEAFCAGDDAPLEELIRELYQYIEEIPFGETVLQACADACDGDAMLAYAFSALAAQLEEICTLQQRAMALLQPVITKESQLATLSDEIAQTQQLMQALDDRDAERLGTLLGALTFARLNLPRPKQIAAAEQVDIVRALRNHAKDLLESLRTRFALPLQFAKVDLPRHATLLRDLAERVAAFDAALFAHKQERAVVGFGDAMRLTLRLLAERRPDGSIVKTPLAEQLSQQYACIMIDEFQDADDQQDLIFRMLSHGGSAERYGDNLFVVGDSKQCIYRFRRANPANFYRAMREGAPYVSPQLTKNTCIHLNRNFRSTAEVVDAVNAIFTPLMTEAIGEICYDKTQKLVQGTEYPAANRPIELLLISPTKETQKTEEPTAVAARIAWHLFENKTLVTDRNGEQRPCRPKDFLILLRSSTRMPHFAQALADAGIPVCPTEQEGYLNSQEITLLLNLLRTVDNPLLDVPMAAAMLSPMMGFSLDELAAVRLENRRKSLFQGMQQLVAEKHAAPSLQEKCAHFLAFLESMRLFSAMETPEQLIRRIYQQTDFLGLMQMSGHGEQKKANLRALVTYARQFEENRGGGLSAFLRYLDAILARKADLAAGTAPAGSEDVVMIKTIHGSKGLEAPFVILAQTDNTFHTATEKETFQFHTDLGFGFRLHDAALLTYGSTLPYELIAARNEQEMKSEELRLLYVALTRAREHLILPLSISNSYLKKADAFTLEQIAFGGQTDCLTRTANSMRDWLMMALLRNPGGEGLRQSLGLEDRSADSAWQRISMYPIPYETTNVSTASEPATEPPLPAPDAALLAEISQQCAWHYDDRLAVLPAKYGVSEIAHGEDFSTPLRRPLFVRERHGLSGAERGTALHTFMQYVDFSAAAQHLEAEIDRLQLQGRLTQRQAKAVRNSTIAAFFTSPLYTRICHAERIRREEKFTVRIADLQLDDTLSTLREQYAGTNGMLTGIMDLVIEEGEHTILVDYKTDSGITPADLLARYTEQIRLYAQALSCIDDKPVSECWLYSFTLQRAIAVPLTDTPAS